MHSCPGQVLLPVVLMLFANISIQASCGAWMYTYALRHVGLSPPDAQAVTALYWAAFTATRLVGVGAARVLHASSIMLITTPAALAGAAAALWGLPGGMDVDAFGHVHGLGGDASMGMAGLPAGLSTRIGAGMALPSLPRSLLMQAQPLPGIQAALLGTDCSSGGMSIGSGSGISVQPGVHEVRLLYGVVVLVGVGVATGFANAVSMTADYIVLDGFINGERLSRLWPLGVHGLIPYCPGVSVRTA